MENSTCKVWEKSTTSCFTLKMVEAVLHDANYRCSTLAISATATSHKASTHCRVSKCCVVLNIWNLGEDVILWCSTVQYVQFCAVSEQMLRVVLTIEIDR